MECFYQRIAICFQNTKEDNQKMQGNFFQRGYKALVQCAYLKFEFQNTQMHHSRRCCSKQCTAHHYHHAMMAYYF